MGPRGVRANVLEPGFVRTRMTRPVPAVCDQNEDEDGDENGDSELLQMAANASALGRAGTPQEVGSIGAMMLVGEEAAFVTGATWTADGGLGVGMGRM